MFLKPQSTAEHLFNTECCTLSSVCVIPGTIIPVTIPNPVLGYGTRPAGLSSDLHPPRSIEGKSRTKLCQKRPQVPGLGHLQSYARFKGGKTKQGYQRMVGWCRLMVMVMADGDG